jgi:hypothetical protein
MANKMTYVSVITDVLNGVELTDEHKEKLTALKASLEKRASGERKPTATQKANVAVKEAIAEFLGTVEFATATEVGKACGEISNQKASALLKQMVDEGSVVKFTEKRKTYFKIA